MKLIFENHVHESGDREEKLLPWKPPIFKAVSYVQELNLTLHYLIVCII